MTTLVDTSVIIDVLRGEPRAADFMEGLGEVPFASELTRIETLRGMRSQERLLTELLFRELSWVPVDEAIARRAGGLGRRWRRSHPGISTTDLAIAATAQELDAELATANVRHFPMFQGLRPPY
jgi:predicted nucleic acid-binding protein